MKRLLSFLLIAVLSNSLCAQTTWKADPMHSKLTFSTIHLGISEVTGLFKTFEVSAIAGKADFSDAVFNLSVNVASVNTELKNALDFLYREWNYKPVAMVNYGGVAGGTRSAEALKPVLTSLKMMPIVESVNIPFFQRFIDDELEIFNGDEPLEQSAHVMIKEFIRWTEALKPMRTPSSPKKVTPAHTAAEAD